MAAGAGGPLRSGMLLGFAGGGHAAAGGLLAPGCAADRWPVPAPAAAAPPAAGEESIATGSCSGSTFGRFTGLAAGAAAAAAGSSSAGLALLSACESLLCLFRAPCSSELPCLGPRKAWPLRAAAAAAAGLSTVCPGGPAASRGPASAFHACLSSALPAVSTTIR